MKFPLIVLVKYIYVCPEIEVFYKKNEFAVFGRFSIDSDGNRAKKLLLQGVRV